MRSVAHLRDPRRRLVRAALCALVVAGAGFTHAQAPLKLNGPLTTRTVAGPAWARNEPIYEVNWDVYGFAKGKAMAEFEKRLPTLKKLGIGIVWLMPIHPRGFKKGFGSPYAVRDYTAINPDLGTKSDFKHLITRAHALGLHILMDWVPNHTSWDNPLIESHPEFYVKNPQGEISQAFTWSDVAQLDYGQPGKPNVPLWNTMRDDMTYWVREFKVDGFRCDVAGRNGKVAPEFWRWLRPQLNAIRPVFMLAEADDSSVYLAFDMSYCWDMPPVFWDVCAGRKPASAIDQTLSKEANQYPAGSILMRFIDNHDWHPHADWGWGDKAAIDQSGGMPQVGPLMVLCATLPGKPLLYNGQEMGFVKTNPAREGVDAAKSPVWPFYSQLLKLFRTCPAIVEGSFTKIASDHDDAIYAFERQKGKESVIVVVNLRGEPQKVTLSLGSQAGRYRSWFSGDSTTLGRNPTLDLAAWDYRVYVKQAGRAVPKTVFEMRS